MEQKTLEEIRTEFINNVNDEFLEKEYELFVKSPSVDSFSYMLIGEYTFMGTLIEYIEKLIDEKTSISEIPLEITNWIKDRFDIVTNCYNDYITLVLNMFNEKEVEETEGNV